MKPTLTRLLTHCALVATLSVLTADARAQKPRRPNIVLIMADDLGRETLGCYGGISYRTPHLDRLAERGMLFRHAYAQPLCTPTRVQLMTGKYNHRNWVAFGILDPKERTFGHLLRDAGYKTCIAGKWQLQSYDPPDYPGAEKRRGIGMRAKDAGFDEYCLWHTGDTEDKGSRYADPVLLENGSFRKDLDGRYGPDVWTEFIERFMERHREREFFIYYPMALTHGPFVPGPASPEWADRARRHENDPRYFKDMVEYMDHVVGRIVTKIEALDLREQTLVLFFSDNGSPQEVTSETRSGLVRGGKGLTTDAGTRVPLVASWPGTISPGQVVDDLVDSTDFLPTLLEAAGAASPRDIVIDGRSFLRRLRGEPSQGRDWVFFHYDPRPGWDKDQFRRHRFVRNQRHKLYDDGRLYDVPADVLEQKPIRVEDDSPASARARKALGAVLERMAQDD